MVIEEKDFRLVPVKNDNRFDLELLQTVNKGKENERQEFKNVAYGITMELAMKYIANARIFSSEKESIDMKTYLQEYRNILAELRELCGD